MAKHDYSQWRADVKVVMEELRKVADFLGKVQFQPGMEPEELAAILEPVESRLLGLRHVLEGAKKDGVQAAKATPLRVVPDADA